MNIVSGEFDAELSVETQLLTEDQILTEAQNYNEMFSKLHRLALLYDGEEDAEQIYHNLVGGEIGLHIQWAKSALKRNDRIVWYLRLVRIGLAARISDQPEVAKYLNQELSIFADNALKEKGAPIQGVDHAKSQIMRYASNVSFLRNSLKHFFSMPIPEIHNVVFSWQAPSALVDQFNNIEVEWKNERAQFVPLDDEDKPYITFTDGWEWVLLDREYCELEGEAMGHCGNAGQPSRGDRILSLRRRVFVGNEPHWRPSLTFILKKDGMLGEMKGRGNDKPAAKYHRYIISLLESDIVKGISGGGYMPENNFAMTDLSEEESDRLMKLKPGLATPLYYWKTNGVDDTLVEMVHGKGFGLTVNRHVPSFIGFSDGGGRYSYLAKFDDVEAFINYYGSDSTSRLLKMADEPHFDFTSDRSCRQGVWENLPRDTRHAIGLWMMKNEATTVAEYCESNDIEDFDPTDADEVLGVIEWLGDEWADALDNSFIDGLESGTQDEIFRHLQREMGAAWEMVGGMNGYIIYEDGRRGLVYDTPCYLATTTESFLEYVTNGDHEDFEGYLEEEIDFDEPYNGFDGYNEETATENFVEHAPDYSEFLNQIKAAKEQKRAA